MSKVDLAAFGPAEIERLRTPHDWRNIQGESPHITRQKIEMARRLGVAAVLFTPREVTTRTHDLALLQALTSPLKGNVHAALLSGVVPFAGQYFLELRRLNPNLHPHVAYMDVGRFDLGQTGNKETRIITDLDDDSYEIATRVTVTDEVGDEGITSNDTSVHIAERWQLFHPGETLEFGLTLMVDKGIATYDWVQPENRHIGMIGPVVWLAGMGMDGKNKAAKLFELHRWDDAISVSPVQHEKYRESMPEVLDILGERAIMGMDDFIWIDQ